MGPLITEKNVQPPIKIALTRNRFRVIIKIPKSISGGVTQTNGGYNSGYCPTSAARTIPARIAEASVTWVLGSAAAGAGVGPFLAEPPPGGAAKS